MSPAKKQRPFLTDRANSKTHSGTFIEFEPPANPGPHTYIPRSKKENGVMVGDNTALEAKVAELSDKLDILTALIMAQQGTTGEE